MEIRIVALLARTLTVLNIILLVRSLFVARRKLWLLILSVIALLRLIRSLLVKSILLKWRSVPETLHVSLLRMILVLRLLVRWPWGFTQRMKDVLSRLFLRRVGGKLILLMNLVMYLVLLRLLNRMFVLVCRCSLRLTWNRWKAFLFITRPVKVLVLELLIMVLLIMVSMVLLWKLDMLLLMRMVSYVIVVTLDVRNVIVLLMLLMNNLMLI